MKTISYQLVSVATMLRDYTEVEYINEEHKRLCDCADSVYNANIPREMWNDSPDYDYKGLYDRYYKRKHRPDVCRGILGRI